MKTLALALLLVGSLVACRDRKDGLLDRDKAGTTEITSGELGLVANRSAIDRMIAARCAREVTCSNVGPDRPFTDADLCVREVGRRMNAELDTAECPSGIHTKNLDGCLDAIRSESCSNPIDALSRLAQCRTSALCAK